MAEFSLGNVQIRVNDLAEIGDRVPPHVHNFDHVLINIRGKCRVTLADPILDEESRPQYLKHLEKYLPLNDRSIMPPEMLEFFKHDQTLELHEGGFTLVPMEKLHTIEALTPDSLSFCVYAHRTPQGEVVPNFCGYIRAYL